jgi:hypothetical protein
MVRPDWCAGNGRVKILALAPRHLQEASAPQATFNVQTNGLKSPEAEIAYWML